MYVCMYIYISLHTTLPVHSMQKIAILPVYLYCSTCTGNILPFHTHTPSGNIDVFLSHIHLMGAILRNFATNYALPL